MESAGSGGLFLLLTESFAVRALLGTLAATGLVALALRQGVVSSATGRRVLLLAPLTTALLIASFSIGDAFLPQLWVSAPGAAGSESLAVLGQSFSLSTQRGVDVALLIWGGIAGALLTRRAVGMLRQRAVVRRAVPPVGYGELVPVLDRLSGEVGLRRSPELLLLTNCPGGAFTAGLRRPLVVVDPSIVDDLDADEVEGLLAHELAHIRRRDNLVALLAGAAEDVLFFIPPIRSARRWLLAEREETADELAAAATGRPGALASSILTVWESATVTGRRAVACAAVPVRPRRRTGEVTARVERLLSPPRRPAGWRRLADVGVGGAVTAAAVGAALAVPAWTVATFDAVGVAVGYLTPATVQDDEPEAPALATFRALAPGLIEAGPAGPPGGVTGATPVRSGAGAPGSAGTPSCACVPSRTDLRDRRPPHAPAAPAALRWEGSGAPQWRLSSVGDRTVVHDARPVWAVRDPQQHVGLFILSGDV